MNWNALLGRVHVATVLILILAVVGGISVCLGSLEWESYFKDMAYGTGLLSVGRGLAARVTGA